MDMPLWKCHPGNIALKRIDCIPDLFLLWSFLICLYHLILVILSLENQK